MKKIGPVFMQATCLPGFIFLAACSHGKVEPKDKSNLSSFTIQELKTQEGDPAWANVDIDMQRTDGNRSKFGRTIQRDSFKTGKVEDLSILVPQGHYKINLIYKDSSNKLVYQACENVRSNDYNINEIEFKTEIAICKEGSTTPVATVQVSPTSNVEITPRLQNPSPAKPDDSTKQVKQTGPCIKDNYGLATSPAPASRIQFDQIPGPLQLPSLSKTASTVEIKAFVLSVYDSFPVFKQIYENELGISKQQALAFMYADISRESGQDGHWQIDLETGIGGPGRAWGPFQAAVTNFTNGGYNDSRVQFRNGLTGLPVPDMAQFYDPAVSTYAGMKRLADGILTALNDFGPGKQAKIYLLGTLADHNTGWPNAALDENWLQSYGNETLRLMQGYLYGTNLSNDRAFWTFQPEAQICQ
ncbi:MAG: hypothetical protein NTX25_20570 [Proteobacteria bacterium]|nr:hypothetical protein [Pseudomonadota bacterium]